MKTIQRNPEINIDHAQSIVRSATEILNRETGDNPFLVHEELQDMMQKNVGIVRTAEELEQALRDLKILTAKTGQLKAHASSQFNPGWNEAIDLKNLVIMAEAVTKSALMREESRGAHTRIDFEGEREEGLDYNVVIRKKSNSDDMEVEKVKRPDPSEELSKIAYASLEDLEEGRV